MPPLARCENTTRPLDPAVDYRMPPEAHQAYDLVYLVENDVGRQKAWPLIVDESLRLLRPGGVLVLRMTNTPVCSIFALKHQLHQWGGLAPVFEFTCEDGATQFAVRNTRRTARPTSIAGVSFGVITDGKRRDRLFAFIKSIYALERTGGQEVEVLVCGPATIRADLATTFPAVKFVPDTGEFNEQGWITRKKNQLVDLARHDNLVIAHDRYTIDPGFLRALREFGGDFSIAVCRQLRTDGRRFPDWVSLGTQWSWSSPALLEYGDWTPHMYINGGIIIAKKEILQKVRWNELLFWNQAEDVELSRRLMHQGHVPRFARQAIAVSHLVRPGTMEACVPLPAAADRYLLTAGAQENGETMSPCLRFGQPIVFRKRLGQKAALLGAFRCEQWRQGADALELRAGAYGEIGGRLPAIPTAALVLTLRLADPAGSVEAIVNDAPVTAQMLEPLALRLTVPAAHFAQTRVLRLNLRCPQGSLRLASLQVDLLGLAPGMPSPITREGVLALAHRSMASRTIDGGALCLSDLPLLTRGARHVAVITPETRKEWIAVVPFLTALRAQARPDAVIRLVGKPWLDTTPALLGAMKSLVTDWSRYVADKEYLQERNVAFGQFAPELIINTQSPRTLPPDIMIFASHAVGVVGFDCAYDDQYQASLLSVYTRLLPDSENISTALRQALGLEPEKSHELERAAALPVLSPAQC